MLQRISDMINTLRIRIVSAALIVMLTGIPVTGWLVYDMYRSYKQTLVSLDLERLASTLFQRRSEIMNKKYGTLPGGTAFSLLSKDVE